MSIRKSFVKTDGNVTVDMKTLKTKYGNFRELIYVEMNGRTFWETLLKDEKNDFFGRLNDGGRKHKDELCFRC